MLDINLVPVHLRRKQQSLSLVQSSLKLPRETVLGAVIGVLVLLVFMHLVLQIGVMAQFVRLKSYTRQWATIETPRSQVDRAMSEIKRLQGQIKSVKDIVGDKWIPWALVMNEISDNIPRGVWLDKMIFSGKTLVLQGSAVAKNKTEMLSVHGFSSNLKGSQSIAKFFVNVSPASIKTKKIGGTSVADFSISLETK